MRVTVKRYLIIHCLLMLLACKAEPPIRIGFVAALTGSNAALGVDGRDGAILAVEKINAQGGINGRMIQLVTRDDLGTSEGALAADRELIEQEGIRVIVGHMTSASMIAAWDEFQDSGVIFLSPTVSTPLLAGRDDNFLRLIVVNSFVADRLASYAANELRLKRIAVFYDSDNASFTNTYRNDFEKSFAFHGGEIIFDYEFSSQSKPNFRPVLKHLKGINPDGLFIAASAFDTALIAQQAHLEDFKVQMLATNWAFTTDLVENGGAAVDGITAVVSHDESNQTVSYAAFHKEFITRYGRQPTFGAGYGYESILVLAEALYRTNGDLQGLKDAILKTSIIGVHGDISFDAFGDVSRTLYLITVQNGMFSTVRTFPAP